MDIKVGLLGFGSVGKATAKYLLQNQISLSNACTISIEAIYTRTPQKIIDAGISPNLIVNDWRTILQNQEINCIVELIGGIDFPKQVILQALQSNKHVVTANKALLAHHGKEIFTTALLHNVSVAFEASCGGGIPIIKAISEGLAGNRISAVYGVMNGTCNFILTEMDKKRISFTEALSKASDLGLVETDPSLDIDGHDAGHKIALLSSLTSKMNIDIHSIPITGISNVLNKDIFFGEKFNYTMKLIAAAFEVDNYLSIWVHPAFLPDTHPMRYVDKSFNAISTIGHEVGHTFYYGRGAGGEPTNSAIISDLISLANETYQITFKTIGTSMCNDSNKTLVQTGMSHLNSPVYLRVTVQDKPGTLTQITSIFGKYNISIARLLQEDFQHGPHFSQDNDSDSNSTNIKTTTTLAELVIITHDTFFESAMKACKDISKLDTVINAPSMYPIINMPQDHLD